mgnify:CR=1 FL=1
MKFGLKKIILLIILNSACAVQALAASEWLTGIKITHCNEKQFCSELNTDSAQRGHLDSLYAFGEATLKISVKSKEGVKRVTVLQGHDGYYDPDKQRIVLRGLKAKKYSEIVLNMNEGKFIYF